MASKIQDELLDQFNSISGVYAATEEVVTQLNESLSKTTTAANALTGDQRDFEAAAPGSAAADTSAVTPAGVNVRGGAASTQGTDGGWGSTAESVALSVLEGGVGITSLIKGLVGLFDGGAPAAPVLEKYQMPSSLSFESADVDGGLTAADYDQTGAPRLYQDTGAGSGGAGSSGGSAAPQITVNVQALDAQSFMDYSAQIAQAVRGAMLNMSSVNDVVNEL
jgi:hypothetical protein